MHRRNLDWHARWSLSSVFWIYLAYPSGQESTESVCKGGSEALKGDSENHLSILSIIRMTIVTTTVILTLYTLSTELTKSFETKEDRLLGHMNDLKEEEEIYTYE